MLNYIYFILMETYKILFLLIPLLVSVAMVVWLDRRVWAFVQKEEDLMLLVPLAYFNP